MGDVCASVAQKALLGPMGNEELLFSTLEAQHKQGADSKQKVVDGMSDGSDIGDTISHLSEAESSFRYWCALSTSASLAILCSLI